MQKQTAPLKLQPLGDRIIVKPVEKDEKKLASGIIIPDTVSDKEAPAKGTVLATGPGKYHDGKLEPMTVKVGDTVLFSNSSYGYDEVKIDGEKYFILPESSVLGIIK